MKVDYVHKDSTTDENIRKEFSDVIYPTMVIRSQAETIELQEKGYVEEELFGGKVFIVDNIRNPLDVFEIIKYRLKVKVGEYKRELKWGEEEIKKGNERVKKAKEELEKYKKVSDGMITRTFNGISFGVTDLKIEDILKALPREICIYQEDKGD